MAAARELVVLGCASQAPTRYRNHNGYFLRFDREGILFDPGEGTQRQMIFAGVAPSAISAICVTHFHGDHCLGLPGVLARLAMDGGGRPVDVYFPEAGLPWWERLENAAVSDLHPPIRVHPVPGPGSWALGDLRLVADTLDHRTATLGWRVEEPDGRRMLPDRLEAHGIAGPAVGELIAAGSMRVGDAVVSVDEVSEPRRGRKVAFIMDTRPCAGAARLAKDADMLICESTFLSGEADLAERYGHMTAAQAAALALDAGAHHLVLTHYSSRHPDERVFLEEAAAVFPRTSVVRDLDVLEV